MSRAGGVHQAGFTLVEAAIATAVTGLMVVAVGYGVGLSGANVREERRNFQRAALVNSKMCELDAAPFTALVSGADTTVAGGDTFIRTWRITRGDGNGDGTPDAGLFRVLVWVDGDTLRTLRGDLE